MGRIIGIDLGTTNSVVAVMEGGEAVLTDPFDYESEDVLMDTWTGLRTAMSTAMTSARTAAPSGAPARGPGYGLAYSGPGGRPRSQKEFVE